MGRRKSAENKEQNGRSKPLPYNGFGRIWNPPLRETVEGNQVYRKE